MRHPDSGSDLGKSAPQPAVQRKLEHCMSPHPKVNMLTACRTPLPASERVQC